MILRSALVVAAVLLVIAGFTVHEHRRSAAPLWSTGDVVPASESRSVAPNWAAVVDAVSGAVVHVRAEGVPAGADRQGSGFVINPDGYIVTTTRVVGAADRVSVAFVDGRQLSGHVIGRDASADVAVLKVDAKGLPVIPFRDASAIRLGEPVLAVGNPAARQQAVTAGIVSEVRGDDGERVIVTTAPTDGASAGGPLLDAHGRAVGINAVRGGQAHGDGAVAIPIAQVETVLRHLAIAAPAPADPLGRSMAEAVRVRMLRL